MFEIKGNNKIRVSVRCNRCGVMGLIDVDDFEPININGNQFFKTKCIVCKKYFEISKRYFYDNLIES